MTHTPEVSFKPALIISVLILLVMGILSGWAWIEIPSDQQIPVHWGIDGTPDRYGGKIEGLLLMPIITLGILVLMTVVPRIEPRKLNLARSRKAYLMVWIASIIFMAAIHVVLVLSALGRNIDVAMIITVSVGLLFVIIGNYLGKIRSNFFVGIKTPWTLSSDLSWNKTHRLGGWLFVLLGLSMMLNGLMGKMEFFQYLIPAGVLGLVLVTFIYSYIVWKNDPKKQAVGR